MSDTNLFSLQVAGTAGDLVHGSAFLTGNLETTASIHRGIRLALGISLDAGAAVELRDVVVGSVVVGGSARAEVALEAAFPLDLFTEAGMVARASITAEAAAWVAAEIGLSASVFAQALDGRLGQPWERLLRVFLEEIEVTAGVSGRAMIAAEATASVVFAGSLVATPTRPAGFTFAVDAGAGITMGAGFRVVGRLGFRDPSRMLDRLADEVAAVVVDEIERAVASWGPDAAAARQALPFVRFVVPLAVRTGFQVGTDLATRALRDQRAAAGSRVVESFLQEAQEAVLRGLVELAVQGVTELVDEAVNAGLALIGSGDVARLRASLDQAIEAVGQLSRRDLNRPTEWLEALVDVLGPLWTFADAGVLDDDTARAWREGLALAWAAGVVAAPVVAWSSSQPTVPAMAPPAPLAAHVAATIGKPAGTALSIADAVAFVLTAEQEHLAGLAGMAEVGSVVRWLSANVPAASQQQLLTFLLRDAGRVPASRLLGSVLAAISPVVEAQVVPLLDRLRRSSDPAVAELVRQVVRPTVLSLTRVVLPAVATLGTSEESTRIVREKISAVLLQLLSRLALTSTDILLDSVATQASTSLRAIGAASAAGKRPDVHHAVSSGLDLRGIGLSGSGSDVASLIDLAAGTVELWNRDVRPAVVPLVGELLSLGLATGDAALDQLWAGLDRPEQPPAGDRLATLAQRVAEADARLLAYVVPRAVELIGRQLVAMVDAALVALDQAARAAIDVAYQAATALAQLVAQIDQLRRQVDELLARIAAEIAAFAARAQSSIDAAVSRVHTQGWAVVRGVIVAMPLYQWSSPEIRQAILDAARVAYDLAFAALRAVLEAPLVILRQAGQWLHEALMAQIAAGATDPERLRGSFQQRAWALAAPDLKAPISFAVPIGSTAVPITLGEVEVPSGTVVGAVVDQANQAMAAQSNLLTNLSSLGQQVVDRNRQRSLALAQRDAGSGPTPAEVASLRTGQALSVTIDAPDDRRAYVDYAPVRITLRGANPSYVDWAFSVPPRVRLRIGSADYVTRPVDWRAQPDGSLVFMATLAAGLDLLDVSVAPKARAPMASEVEPTGTLAPARRYTQRWDRAELAELQRAQTRTAPPAGIVVRPGPVGISVIVVDGGGRRASASRAIQLTRSTRRAAAPLVVNVSPTPVPVDRAVDLVVRATDAITGSEVAAATILLDGVAVGTSGTTVRRTYPSTVRRTWDPATRTTTATRSSPLVSVAASAPDRPPTSVPLVFATPPVPAGRLAVTVSPTSLRLGRTVTVTVAAKDAESSEPIVGADVVVDGVAVGRTGAPFSWFVPSTTSVAEVRADGYLHASVPWTLQPHGNLRVTTSPASVPLGLPTTVVVSATDDVTGEAIAGDVLVDGVVLGRTGSPVTTTFTRRLRRALATTGGGGGGPELVDPMVVVRARTYADVPVPMAFYDPTLRISVQPATAVVGTPVAFTVRAVDDRSNQAVAGDVRVSGTVVGRTDQPLTFEFSAPGTPVTVTAGGYPAATAPLQVVPHGNLRVSVEPAPPPTGVATAVVFRATDDRSNQPVVGTVAVDGTAVGSTNAALTITFVVTRVRKVDPETKRPYFELTYPTATVSAPTYTPVSVDFRWA